MKTTTYNEYVKLNYIDEELICDSCSGEHGAVWINEEDYKKIGNVWIDEIRGGGWAICIPCLKKMVKDKTLILN